MSYTDPCVRCMYHWPDCICPEGPQSSAAYQKEQDAKKTRPMNQAIKDRAKIETLANEIAKKHGIRVGWPGHETASKETFESRARVQNII